MSISDLQNDTRQAQINVLLSELFCLAEQAPFTQLCEWLEIHLATTQNHIFNHLSMHNNYTDLLNYLIKLVHPTGGFSFTQQLSYVSDHRGYEQIIYNDKQIPTRNNKHDFFNALIWCQFSKTKALLNRLHYQQIKQSGEKQRSRIRDRLTHFDECGLVLFSSSPELSSLLTQHQWQSLFIQHRSTWHTQIVPVIFGHALWEMLTQPFIGVTAKVTIIELTQDKLDLIYSSNSSLINYAYCDELLCEHLQHLDLASEQKPWLPLPLLGVPSWSPFAQNAEFYENQNYFMPLKKQRPAM